MVEDLNTEQYLVDTALNHLIRAGKLDNAAGFVFGTDVNLQAQTVPEGAGVDAVDRGDPRRADRSAGDPRDRQRARRPRQAHGDDAARRRRVRLDGGAKTLEVTRGGGELSDRSTTGRGVADEVQKRVTMAGLLAADRAGARRVGVGLAGRRPGLEAGRERAEDRLGAEPADDQPVRRPGRGGLLDLGDQLGPARQLQPQGPLPGPGHRQELGRLGRQEDGHLPPRPGREVVRRQADHLRGRQVLARDARRPAARCSRATRTTSRSIETPDAHTVVIHTKRPDARIVGGLFIYILPKHVWGKVPVSDLTGSYDPKLPLVGSGPYIVTDFQPNRITTMEQNPNFRGTGAEVRRDPVHQVRQSGRRRAGAAARRGRHGPRGRPPPASTRLGEEPNIDTLKAASPAYTQLAFNSCPKEICPDAQVQPGRAGPRRSPGHRLRGRPRADQRDRRPRTRRSSATASCRRSTRRSTSSRPQDYPLRPRQGEADPRRRRLAGRTVTAPGPRATRSSRSTSTFARSRPTTSRRPSSSPSRPRPSGSTSTSRSSAPTSSTELTIRKVDGKPAPDFDTFIWGWGGDPYDPSFLLSSSPPARSAARRTRSTRTPSTTGSSSSRPASSTPRKRKAIIQRMVASTQRDLPYLVLTYDPNLQAYRTDRVANVEPVCPEATGDAFCEQTSYEPLLTIAPGSGERRRAAAAEPASSSRSVAVVVGGSAFVFFVIRAAPAPRREPVELERVRRASVSGALAGRQGRRGAGHVRVRPRLQLLPVPGDGRPDHPACPPAAGDPGGDPEAAARLRARQAAHRSVRRLRRRHARTSTSGSASAVASRSGTRSRSALPWTLLLVGTGTLLATLIGSWMGVVAATRRGKKTDDGLLGFSLFTYAAPEYWIGIILILVFAVWIPIFPPGLQVTPGEEFSELLRQGLRTSPSTWCCRPRR